MDTELITRYVRGLTTDEEDKEILRSLEESPANRALFADIMAIEAADAAEKTTPYDTDRMLDCLNSRIDADARRPSRRWIAWSGWAVAAALLAGMTGKFFARHSTTSKECIEGVWKVENVFRIIQIS